MAEIITSRKNRKIIDAHALADKKTRDKTGLFAVEGIKLLNELISENVKLCEVYYTKGAYSRFHESIDIAQKLCPVFEVTDEVYEKLSFEKTPEGVFAVFEKASLPVSDKKSAVLILEGIQDPGNMGTLLRCAVAFGIKCVIAVSCTDPYNPKTVRASMGAVFKMPCISFGNIDSAVEYARELCDLVVATALHTDSVSIEEVDTSHAAIMIGSEGRGLSERAIELADKKVIIPIENIESLNASVAGAICMYTAMMKRKNK